MNLELNKCLQKLHISYNCECFESKKKAYSDNLYDLSSEKFKEHETIII